MLSQKAPFPATKELLDGIAREVSNITAGDNPLSPKVQNPAMHPLADDSSYQALAVEAEQLVRSTLNPASRVGRMPPQPPTLRGRVGAPLVRFVKRCLFWYTEQINEINVKIAESLRRHAYRLSNLASVLEQTRAEQQRIAAEFRNELHGLAQDRDALQCTSDHAVNQLRSLNDTINTFREEITDLAQLARSLCEQMNELQCAVPGNIEATMHNALQVERVAMEQHIAGQFAEVREGIRKAELFTHQTRAALYAQEGRISILMEERGRDVAKQGPAVIAPVTQPVSTEELGSLYLAFENVFRGSRADIKQRVAEYLPRLIAKNLGTPHMPVLDLGCGRGEWLEVLVESGRTGVGVDSNEAFASECRNRGLTVHLADAIEYLRQKPSESEGVVTAFHVVEHLPFRVILNLLDEAVRVLKPGGMLILETPNPANVLVGSNTFYLDPSHIRPLPADLLRFIVESRGFCNVEAIPLHPFEDCYRLNDKGNPAAALLNDLIYGPRDYAIVAERP